VIVFDAYDSTPASTPATERILLTLEGQLDITAAQTLSVLDETVRSHPGAHVLVDLADVTFLDAAVLNAFTVAKAGAEASGGRLSFHGASAFTRGLLELWHLGPVRPIEPVEPVEPRTLRDRSSAPAPAHDGERGPRDTIA
jgi:anti-anti-sigma regulatory factor